MFMMTKPIAFIDWSWWSFILPALVVGVAACVVFIMFAVYSTWDIRH